MATYVKFIDFVEQIAKGVHIFGTHTYKIALTNTAPTNTDTSFLSGSLHPPPANTNGYTAGGNALSVTISEAAGTATAVDDQTTFTASGGTLGPFRYAILYNDTATSPADALVSYWDYGSSITLNDGETFKVSFNNDDTDGTIFTLA